jgi:RNA polymerase sigma-70 factor (ECF subfamily)
MAEQGEKDELKIKLILIISEASRRTMQSSAYQTNQSIESLTILKRIVEADKTAVENCIDTYGNLVWAMAREHTDSLEEAEIVTRKIFLDIWRYAGRCGSTKFDETAFIILIARRRLIKYLSNNSF